MNTQNIGEGKEIHQPETIPSPVQETAQDIQKRWQDMQNSEGTSRFTNMSQTEYELQQLFDRIRRTCLDKDKFISGYRILQPNLQCTDNPVESITRYIIENMSNIFPEEDIDHISEYIDKMEQCSVDTYGQSIGERIQNDFENWIQVSQVALGNIQKNHLYELGDFQNNYDSAVQGDAYYIRREDIDNTAIQVLKEDIIRCLYEIYI